MRGSILVAALGSAVVIGGLCVDARASGQDPAEAVLQEAAAQQQPAQSGPAVEAMRLFDAGRHAEAIPFFDRALSDDPDNEQLLHLSLIARAEAGRHRPTTKLRAGR